eukprot:425920-Prymnesium_polylepis.1
MGRGTVPPDWTGLSNVTTQRHEHRRTRKHVSLHQSVSLPPGTPRRDIGGRGGYCPPLIRHSL